MTMIKDVRVVLNGNEVFGYKGQRILDLCSDNGIEIPTFCYNEHLTPHGGCSVCLVEVEGAMVTASVFLPLEVRFILTKHTKETV